MYTSSSLNKIFGYILATYDAKPEIRPEEAQKFHIADLLNNAES